VAAAAACAYVPHLTLRFTSSTAVRCGVAAVVVEAAAATGLDERDNIIRGAATRLPPCLDDDTAAAEDNAVPVVVKSPRNDKPAI
jgi:hypothetical protein